MKRPVSQETVTDEINVILQYYKVSSLIYILKIECNNVKDGRQILNCECQCQ